ncbi:MAG: glycerol kinase GlpK [Bryobacteraceae bacterium]|nr:glycerol kinase GlpK [Bryobacteraceae bacterium]
MPLLLALDQGTTSSRAIIFDPSGRALATAQKEFTQIFPQPGWVEHDPMEIWSSQVAVAAEAAAKVSNLGEHVAAAGITNQRETTLIWDRKTGAPVYNAIVWQDRRTASICARLKSDGLEPLFRQKTGLLLDPYFSGTKVKWILDNVDGVRARAERGELAFGTVDTWLLWNLTQGRVHSTDPSNASRTLLYNIRTCAWDADILELLGIPASLLPEVKPSSGVFGEISHPMGLDNVPVAGIAGDQQSALFGQACYQPGLAKNTYGTGCFLLMNTGTQAIESKNNLLTTIAWQKDGQVDYALEGSVFIGGAVVQWLRDSLGVIRSSAEVEALASSVPNSGGVLFVPAFAGLGAPHWDPYARGAIVGLTRGSTSAHIARAALDSIAYQVADLLDAINADSGVNFGELRVDGGASNNNLLLQTQADLLQRPVARALQTETTALGAAWLAGLGVGVYNGTAELQATWRAGARFEPRISPDQASASMAEWRRAVDRARGWERP